MSVQLESVERINALKEGIEAVTGESYEDLTAGVQVLKEGYSSSLSKVTDFTEFFMNGRRAEAVNKIDTSNAINMNRMHFHFLALTEVPVMNTSKVVDMSEAFNECNQMPAAPVIDTGNVTNFDKTFRFCRKMKGIIRLDTKSAITMMSTFNNCNEIEEIYLSDTSKVTSFCATFYQCQKLRVIGELYMYGDISVTFTDCESLEVIDFKYVNINNDNLDLSGSPNLTEATLIKLLNALSNNTNLSTTYTVKIGTANLNKLSMEQKLIALDKNISLQ